jgi:uncharacterized protein (TIGR02996 family)
MTEDDWKAAVMAQPEDQTIWHAIADCLEEQDQPLRAELVRLSRIRVGENPQRVMDLLDAGVEPVIPVFRNMLGMQFAYVQAGKFRMGSPATEAWRYYEEFPHEVTLTEPFYIGVFPVTVGEFARFVEATGYKTEAENNSDSENWRTPRFEQDVRHPVICVNWNDVQAMVKWLNQVNPHARLVHSLPTEAQWEYACRAGNPGAYHWGDEESRLAEFAWFMENSEGRTWPVETKKPNVWGLWHMHGQIWEWCEDWYELYPERAVQNPKGPASERLYRVTRGGSWSDAPRYSRSACRGVSKPSVRNTLGGFRLVVSAQPAEPK